MNIKKLLPVLLLIIMLVITLTLKQCANNLESISTSESVNAGSKNITDKNPRFSRNVAKFYFTKHARCRMACRHITQQEVKEILANGVINYNKSDLDDKKGPTYALEGETKDRQRVRVIFAPKQRHMSVVTVIDLDHDYDCDCD